MTKERLNDLETYKAFIEGRIASDIPEKHKEHPKAFKAYLQNELRMVKLKIEKAKMQ